MDQTLKDVHNSRFHGRNGVAHFRTRTFLARTGSSLEKDIECQHKVWANGVESQVIEGWREKLRREKQSKK